MTSDAVDILPLVNSNFCMEKIILKDRERSVTVLRYNFFMIGYAMKFLRTH